jgi:hypothetical protein
MSKTPGDAIGIASESSPSIGLAVVDSMTGRQIKAFASHAQGFSGSADRPAKGRLSPREARLPRI